MHAEQYEDRADKIVKPINSLGMLAHPRTRHGPSPEWRQRRWEAVMIVPQWGYHNTTSPPPVRRKASRTSKQTHAHGDVPHQIQKKLSSGDQRRSRRSHKTMPLTRGARSAQASCEKKNALEKEGSRTVNGARDPAGQDDTDSPEPEPESAGGSRPATNPPARAPRALDFRELTAPGVRDTTGGDLVAAKATFLEAAEAALERLPLAVLCWAIARV